MAYMVYQRYTSAVKRAYRGRPDVAVEHERAIEFGAWLESLEIDPAIRADLVEQARALEHGFEELMGSSRPTTPGIDAS
jgi:hypothetical protein